jgi:hypothetical protein
VTNTQILPQYSANYIECYLSNRKTKDKQCFRTSRCANSWSLMEYDQRIIVRFLHTENMQPDQVHTRLKAQFEDNINSLCNAQYQCQYIRQRREDRKQSGSFYWIHSLENYGMLWSRAISFSISIAEALSISHLIVFRHLWDLLDMKNCHLQWISQTWFIFKKLTRVFRRKFLSLCFTTVLFIRYRTFRLLAFQSYKYCMVRT